MRPLSVAVILGLTRLALSAQQSPAQTGTTPPLEIGAVARRYGALADRPGMTNRKGGLRAGLAARRRGPGWSVAYCTRAVAANMTVACHTSSESLR